MVRLLRAAVVAGAASVLVGGSAAAAEAPADPPPRVLVFSRTTGFRHASIPAGISALRRLGVQNGFGVDATEDPHAFTDAGLARYRAVVWLSTSGDVLGPTEQAAFQRYVTAGGGFVGIHSAAATEPRWRWYGSLLGGARFLGHSTPQRATVEVTDRSHASTRGLPRRWRRLDEWYAFRPSPRPRAHVLARIAESTYRPGRATMRPDHPIAWCRRVGAGRAWYTAGGHTRSSFREPLFLRHLLGGLTTAAGLVPDGRCAAGG
jgi:type 1 glutamine amidotransferase